MEVVYDPDSDPTQGGVACVLDTLTFSRLILNAPGQGGLLHPLLSGTQALRGPSGTLGAFHLLRLGWVGSEFAKYQPLFIL